LFSQQLDNPRDLSGPLPPTSYPYSSCFLFHDHTFFPLSRSRRTVPRHHFAIGFPLRTQPRRMFTWPDEICDLAPLRFLPAGSAVAAEPVGFSPFPFPPPTYFCPVKESMFCLFCSPPHLLNPFLVASDHASFLVLAFF